MIPAEIPKPRRKENPVKTFAPIAFADYLTIAIFCLFIVLSGQYFSRNVRGTRDYFAAGSVMPWWLSGISFYMAAKTAFIFVTYNEIAYLYGITGIVIYWMGPPAMLLGGYFLAHRWRRARILTPLEFTERRYDGKVHQLLMWAGLPLRLLDNGLRILTTGIFITVILSRSGLSLWLCLFLLGAIMVIYSFLGGQWVVVITDFVLAVIIIAATGMLFVLSLKAMGPFPRFIAQAPPGIFQTGPVPLRLDILPVHHVSPVSSFPEHQLVLGAEIQHRAQRKRRPAHGIPGRAAHLRHAGRLFLPGGGGPGHPSGNRQCQGGLRRHEPAPPSPGTHRADPGGHAQRDHVGDGFRIQHHLRDPDHGLVPQASCPAGHGKKRTAVRPSGYGRGRHRHPHAGDSIEFLKRINPPRHHVPFLFGSGPSPDDSDRHRAALEEIQLPRSLLGRDRRGDAGTVLVSVNLILTQVHAEAMRVDPRVNFWLRSGWTSVTTMLNISITLLAMWIGSVLHPAPADESRRAEAFFADLERPFEIEAKPEGPIFSPMRTVGNSVLVFGLMFTLTPVYLLLFTADRRAFRLNLIAALAIIVSGFLLRISAGRR